VQWLAGVSSLRMKYQWSNVEWARISSRLSHTNDGRLGFWEHGWWSTICESVICVPHLSLCFHRNLRPFLSLCRVSHRATFFSPSGSICKSNVDFLLLFFLSYGYAELCLGIKSSQTSSDRRFNLCTIAACRGGHNWLVVVWSCRSNWLLCLYYGKNPLGGNFPYLDRSSALLGRGFSRQW
jgi:hypothetical protein